MSAEIRPYDNLGKAMQAGEMQNVVEQFNGQCDPGR